MATRDGHDAAAFPIVGIGASAGGLEAFTSLFGALPPDTGMAFVLVPHLAPSHASSLADILSRATSMPVMEVADEPAVQPNHVYVIPPGRDMAIAQGKLHLRDRDPHALHRSVDHFFRSLAQDQGDHAIGVILSGTATDGTLGLSAIKAEGGITFAQDDSAQQTGMPHSAIAEGSVDFVLPPHEIAKELARIAQHPRLAGDAPLADNGIEADLRRVLHAVRQGTGVDFTHYKANTLHRRVTRRMILTKTSNLADYAAMLHKTPVEVEALHHDLLIGVTSFFRNPEAFEALKTKVFPKIARGDRGDDPVRIWVLGCSTGEEAYSIAIAFAEYAETLERRVPVQIFASDLNAAGIETARAGAYSKDLTRDVSPERLRRFFTSVDGQSRIIKSIRDMCLFSRHNVLTDPPFSRMDLVSCRNLLIYLEPVLQQQVIPVLHYALKPTGMLWLGSAESIGAQRDSFEVEDARHKIFSKKPGTSCYAPLFAVQRQDRRHQAASRSLNAREDADVLKESDRLLLARFAPAGVLVSPSMEILQYRGDVGPYVSPAPGKASLNLLKVLATGLQVAVRSALLRAKREQSAAREESVQIRSYDGGLRNVTLEVIPVRSGNDGFLVLFETLDPHRPTRDASKPRTRGKERQSEATDQRVERLTKELTDTREYLQSVIEQQEAAHEELQSANEEVQSSNEELQSINEELETSKEEIQSSNEELSTVNDELNHRNAELTRTNNDLLNLLSSSHLAVIFVGRDLRIRRYTLMAESLLSLIPADVGRPVGDLRLKLTTTSLEDLLVTAMDTLTASEQDVQDEGGRWYSLRVRPYRTLDNQIDGAVIVLVDIDALTRARLYAESIIATVREPLVVLDAEARVVTANAAFYRTFRIEPRTTEGRSFFDLGNRAWDLPELHALIEQTEPPNQAFNDLHVILDVGNVGRKAFMLNARRLVQAADAHPLVLLAIEDVSERRHTEDLQHQRVVELSAADKSKNEFLAMLAHELRNPLAPIRTAAQILGTPGVPDEASVKARVIIDRQIGTMTRLIEDLLDVARVSQGKIEMRMEPVDLAAVLQHAVELVQRQADERDQTLSVTPPSEPWYLRGDSARLEQAFGNLLHNASKFTPRSGHITLTVDKIETADGSSTATVRIRDDGIGITAAMLPTVFDLFKQGEQSPHHAPGLGVGLALVQRIVALHGGTVKAQSGGGKQGSEFIVSLPLDADGAAGPIEAPIEPPAEVDELRILVVDDNVDAAESLAALLRLRKHDVRVAHDGLAALEVATGFDPQIVFLDIAMPDMDGYEVARRMRRRPELESTVLVALTALGRDEDRRLASDAGFDHHVTKPLDPAALLTLLAHDSSDDDE